jgi:electron transfer flavoprotein beta subunit
VRIAVCLKHAPRRVGVDALTGAVAVDPRDVGLSAADEAALELGLRLGEVTAVTAGPSDDPLRVAASVGAVRLVRCPADADAGSAAVATALAAVVADADLVLCGDYSADRGSGAVPAFVAATLGVAQALGVVSVGSDLVVQRRLDRGRREVLQLPTPAVLSVEGSVLLDGLAVRLRRASIAGERSARTAVIETGGAVAGSERGTWRPHRPRVQLRPAPSGTPFERIQAVTQATVTRNPPRLVTLDPPAAAAEILSQLQAWGYLP